MKNILIVTGIYPPDIGGPATFTKNLREFINKSEYKVIVITLSNIQNYIEFENNIIKIKRNIPKLIRTTLVILYIRKYAKKSISILSCGLIFESFLGTLGLKKNKSYRFVGDSIWEKYIAPKTQINLENAIYPFHLYPLVKMRNIMLNNFNKIITPSEFLKSYIVKNLHIKKDKVVIIENFCDITKKNFTNKISQITTKKVLKLVTLSRLVKWKNIDTLINVSKKLEAVQLNIIGSGPEEKYLKKLANKNVNIIFHGLLNKSNSINLLNSCDCFIQISSYEGMSFSILESLFLNKPMILSSIKANFETAKTASLYVNQYSKFQIFSAIELMKDKKIRKHFSLESKFINNTFYNKEKSLKKYIHLLK